MQFSRTPLTGWRDPARAARARLLLTVIAGAFLSGTAMQGVFAAAPNPGDLIIYQQGTSATPTSTTVGVPINLVEITPTASSLVQNITIPTNALVTESAGSEGNLSLSNNGTLLSFTGYTGGSVANETNNAGRAVGTLDSTGTLNYPAGGIYSNSATGTQTRGAYSSDGTYWYMADKSGIYYNGASSIISGSPNTRAIKNFGGTTYILQATAGSAVVSSISPSTPGSSSPTISITGITPSTGDANAVDFTMVSSGHNGSTFDTIYYTDGTGIFKFAFGGSSWSPEGSITGLGSHLTGITAALDPIAGVDLYVTSSSSSSNIAEEITDSAAYNATAVGNTATVLYTAPTGDLVRGISFAPVPEPTSLGLLFVGGLLFLRRKPRVSASI